MKTRLLPILCLAALGLSAMASADRVYYLVGLRHVYSVPVFPDPHELDRQAIEEDYAGAVAQGQKQYDADMASIHDEETKDNGNIHQVDRDAVQENLEKAIADASDRREGDLASLYTPADDVRQYHPEFKVEQDGPYKVIGLDTAPSGDYVNIVYYRPYPAYYEPCPYGWGWGRPYAYSTWGIQIGLWHSTWISIGCPCYEPMYYGGVVFVVDAPIRTEVIYTRSAWVGGYPPHITDAQRQVLYAHRDAQERAHYYDQARSASMAAGGVKLRAPIAPPVTRGTATPGQSPYSHRTSVTQASGAAGAGGSRYSHSATGTSRYSRTPGSGTTGSTSAGSTTTGVSKYSRTGSSSTSTGASSSRYGRTTGSSSSSTSTSKTGSSTSTGTSRYGRSSTGSTGTSKTGSTTKSTGSTGSSSGSNSSGSQKKNGGN